MPGKRLDITSSSNCTGYRLHFSAFVNKSTICARPSTSGRIIDRLPVSTWRLHTLKEMSLVSLEGAGVASGYSQVIHSKGCIGDEKRIIIVIGMQHPVSSRYVSNHMTHYLGTANRFCRGRYRPLDSTIFA